MSDFTVKRLAFRSALGLYAGTAIVVAWAFGEWPVHQVLLCLAFGLALTASALCVGLRAQRKLIRVVKCNQIVRVFYVQERPGIWSSHLEGVGPRLWREFCLRLCGKRVQGIKIARTREERDQVNLLSALAFEDMLDMLGTQPGSVIISASVLNYPDRQPNRLAERVAALERCSQVWQYHYIERKLDLMTTVLGRLLFAWPVRADVGESYWQAVVPGIVAWRVLDAECLDAVLIVKNKIQLK